MILLGGKPPKDSTAVQQEVCSYRGGVRTLYPQEMRFGVVIVPLLKGFGRTHPDLFISVEGNTLFGAYALLP